MEIRTTGEFLSILVFKSKPRDLGKGGLRHLNVLRTIKIQNI